MSLGHGGKERASPQIEKSSLSSPELTPIFPAPPYRAPHPALSHPALPRQASYPAPPHPAPTSGPCVRHFRCSHIRRLCLGSTPTQETNGRINIGGLLYRPLPVCFLQPREPGYNTPGKKECSSGVFLPRCPFFLSQKRMRQFGG